MPYHSALSGDLVQIGTPPPKKTRLKGTGCDNCPLDKVKGINKVINTDRIKGRRIMVWGQSPGGEENDRGRELIGRSGQFLWEELDQVGVSRSDCDVQNVVRCRPTKVNDNGYVVDRPPTKEEIHCCTVHTEEALRIQDALVHVVLGQVAGQALLGREFKKTKAIFWSDKLNAWVVCLDHPSYFIRGQAPAHRLEAFRYRVSSIPKLLKTKSKFAYLEKQDYQLACRPKRARRFIRELRRAAMKGHRLTVDIEDGIVDPDTNKAVDVGVRAILVIGFSWRPGKARVFALDHPDNKASERERCIVKRMIKDLLEDPEIKKTMHHGTHDSLGVEKILGVKVQGYEFDTNYSTYLKWPAQKKYGLDEHSRVRVTEFSGYKDIVKPYLADKVNYATIPLPIMRLYNGADNDLTKRLELMTRSKDGPLLRAYLKVAFVLHEMEHRGPYFDAKYYDKVVYLVPQKLAKVERKLKRMANNPDFNPNSHIQCSKLVYEKFRMPVLDKHGKLTTDKNILKTHAQMTKTRPKGAEFCENLSLYKKLDKMEGTYLSNYRESAEINNGMLLTIWWLTGTITGRLRSGGSDRPGIVNMQNLHGEPMLQNLLVSDLKWRLLPKYFRERTPELRRRLRRLQLFLAADYSQIEVRILAEMSGDPLLISHFTNGEDLHSMVGHILTGRPPSDFMGGTLRRMIKEVHFGIIYGMSETSLFKKLISEGVKVTQGECSQYLKTYFRKYSKVKQLIENLRESGERDHYVETLFGFRRPIYSDGDEGRDTYWGNQAINSPIQGSAHQLMLFAMAILADKPPRYNLLSKPVMEVHDSFVFYNEMQYMEEAYAQMQHLLQVGVAKYIKTNFKRVLKVPLVAEAKAGFRLGVMSGYAGEPYMKFAKSWNRTNQEVDREVMAKWAA